MSSRFKANFTFGGSAAESDHLLLGSYLDNGDYEAMESHDDKRCFVIGRTGSGKSAAFRQLEEKQKNKVIRLDPESLSLPYILNLDVIRDLLKLGVHLEPFMKTLWKHIMVVEILRHRYKIDSPEKKHNVLQSLLERFKKDPGKADAIKYVNEFGDKFWCETDERVKQIADTFVKKIGASGGIDTNIPTLNAKLSSNSENTVTKEIKQEIAAKYQKIVNDTQLPHLNKILTILNDAILDSSQHFTYIIIDDLDKEWIEEDLAILLIKCLFQAVVDMQKIKHLKILVALRTNIFNQLNYGKQIRGGQEEKFRELAIELRWTYNDLQNLLENRARVACQYYQIIPPKTLEEMLPRQNKRATNPIQYIIEHTLMRPRDAIIFLNRCLKEASGKEKITFDNICQAEKFYSQNRLLALRDEWKDPYIGLDKVFKTFEGKAVRISRSDIEPILEDIALLLVEEEFHNTTWLNEICYSIFEKGNDWNKMYKPIINFLYSISFIGVGCANKRIRYSYEEHGLTYLTEDLGDDSFFEVHKAFRQALNIKN